MTERMIEICKNRIEELLCAKLALIQIIADYDDEKDNIMNKNIDNKENDDNYMILIEWKIQKINKTILELKEYMNSVTQQL